MFNRKSFGDMRRSGFGVSVSKTKVVKAMVEVLDQLPIGTKQLKETVVANMGMMGQMVPTREINAAWNEAKKKAAKQFPDKFILGSRNILSWNDGSVKVLDKKISAANFRKLNDLADAEGCSVNQIVSKLVRSYKAKNKG